MLLAGLTEPDSLNFSSRIPSKPDSLHRCNSTILNIFHTWSFYLHYVVDGNYRKLENYKYTLKVVLDYTNFEYVLGNDVTSFCYKQCKKCLQVGFVKQKWARVSSTAQNLIAYKPQSQPNFCCWTSGKMT